MADPCRAFRTCLSVPNVLSFVQALASLQAAQDKLWDVQKTLEFNHIRWGCL